VVNSVIALALVLVVALTVWTVRTDDTADVSATQTSTVDRGAVAATVTASGNVESATTVNVDFEGSGGVVEAVFVKEGQRVDRGDRLAMVDRTSARQGLRSALATLQSARASYATTTQGRTAQEQAQDQQSINVSQQSVSSAEVSLRGARNTLALDRSQQNAAVARAERALNSATAAEERAQQAYDNDPSAANKQALTEAKTSVSTARTSLTSAKDTRASVLLADQQAVDSQAAALRSAQAQLQSTRATVSVNQQGAREGAVESALAQINSAQVTVDEARRTLAQTILRAPASGTISSITGVVGETSSGSSTSSTSSSSSTGSESSATSSTSTSGFITMSALDVLEVTADVAEADITDVEVGQQATVTLSANDLEIPGVVTSVDTVETVTNNVVEYGVTIRLDRTKGVRLGQTSAVTITTGSKDDVLRVSSSALTTIGDQTTATVQHDDGTTDTVVVTTGLQGDSETEVLSGLAVGDVVVLPQQESGGQLTFPGGGLGGGIGGTP
jgi:multidrug efflux pump subunit AcrA (membrane-fusion protein)